MLSPIFSCGGGGEGGGGEQPKKSNITLMLNQKIPDNSLSLQVLQHTLGPTRTRSRCGRW